MGAPETLIDMMKRFARIIPGIGTYQDRESRRDTDKRFRVWLADGLDGERRRLSSIKEKQSPLEYLDELDRLERAMQRIADSIRYASYGYGGLFDSVKIDDEKLSEIYRCDLDMAEDLDNIRTALNGLAEEVATDIIQKARDSIDRLDKKLRRRSNLFLEIHK